MTDNTLQPSRRIDGLPAFGMWHLGLILIVIGTLISAYLSYTHLFAVDVACVENAAFDCAAVQNSTWSEMFGIPVAYGGFASYLLLGSLWLFQERNAFLRDNGMILIFTLAFVSWLFSMWLVYVQVAIIDALCQWCIAHEVTISMIFGIVIYRLLRE